MAYLLEFLPVITYLSLVIDYCFSVITPGRRQSKTPLLSRSVDQKSIETVYSTAICAPLATNGNRKHLFLLIFDRRSSIVDNIFNCRLPGVVIAASYIWVYIEENSVDPDQMASLEAS